MFERIKCKIPEDQWPFGIRTLASVIFVRLKGLEPPRLSAPDPKSGVATNYTTAAAYRGAKVCVFWLYANDFMLSASKKSAIAVRFIK